LELQENQPGATVVSRSAAKRPLAVTLVGILGLGAGVYYIVDGVLVIVSGGDTSKLAGGAFELALGVLVIGIGAGVLRMRRWAWVAFMTWAVVGLTQQLLRHFFYDHPNYVAMALNTVAVLALTPLDVQAAFGVRPPRNARLVHAVPSRSHRN